MIPALRLCQRALPIVTLIAIFATLLSAQEAHPLEDEAGVRVINNVVSPERDWAAGSFGANEQDRPTIVLNTRPIQRLFKELPFSIRATDSQVVWTNTVHSAHLHQWIANDFAGLWVHAQALGEFVPESGESGGEGDRPGEDSGGSGPDWKSNSLDIDIDVGEFRKNNPRDFDIVEMDPIDPDNPRPHSTVAMGQGNETHGYLRKLPPQVDEKWSELYPKVWIKRVNTNVDIILPDGQSIFTDDKELVSVELQDRIRKQELHLLYRGRVRGETVLTAVHEFTDPVTGYRHDFRDSVRLLVERTRVFIDVDVNRDGQVNPDTDRDGKNAPIDFLAESGALVLVNCDSDVGGDKRDMDVIGIANDDDAADMSPVRLELTGDLADDEELWVVVRNLDASGGDRADTRMLDSKHRSNPEVIGNSRNEVRVDREPLPSGDILFPEGKADVIANRLLLEGIRFGVEVAFDIEIRRNDEVIERDTARVLNCPWIANHNLQSLANVSNWRLPGNMISSSTAGFKWTRSHGSRLVYEGGRDEYVQDSNEWGFQIRWQNEGVSRSMIVGLKLASAIHDNHALKFLGGRVGVYGYHPEDESYHIPGNVAGDAGGNLEVLPPMSGHPYGRIIHTQAMSGLLQDWLARQNVQTRGGAVIIDTSSAPGLDHVDEVICITSTGNGGWTVIMPTYDGVMDILAAHPSNFTVQRGAYLGDVGPLWTYQEILDAINEEEGPANDAFQAMLRALAQYRKTVEMSGAEVQPLPVLFAGIKVSPQQQNPLPRSINANVANSQPTRPGRIVTRKTMVSDFDDLDKTMLSPFFSAWINRLGSSVVILGEEDLDNAWQGGGEAHCVSQSIREPYRGE